MLHLRPILQSVVKQLPRNARSFSSNPSGAETVDTAYMDIPISFINKPQSLEKRKARLVYQSRKRGMLENDLILGTFVKKHLDGFTEEQTIMYDRLINSPSNDWDIFHWIVGKKPTPEEFDNEIMDLLKKHAKNEDKVLLSLPDLN